MDIVWDPRKRLANIEKRGLDFALVTIEFLSTSLIVEAKERRSMAIGDLDGLTYLQTAGSGGAVCDQLPSGKQKRKAPL